MIRATLFMPIVAAIMKYFYISVIDINNTMVHLHFRLNFVMFFKVKSIRLVGILLMVFIENKHLSFVKDVCAESVATGIMGLMV